MIYQPIFSFFIIIQFYFRYKLINHYDTHPSMINHHQYTKSQQYGYVEHPPIRYNYHQPRSLHQPVATNDLFPIQHQPLQGNNDIHNKYVERILSNFTIVLSLEQLLRGVFVLAAPPTMGVGTSKEYLLTSAG